MMGDMTSRERVLSAIYYEIPDWVLFYIEVAVQGKMLTLIQEPFFADRKMNPSE